MDGFIIIADVGRLRLCLQRQGQERGEGREGPDTPTPRPPRFGSLERGSSGVNTRVIRSAAWLQVERSSVPVNKDGRGGFNRPAGAWLGLVI